MNRKLMYILGILLVLLLAIFFSWRLFRNTKEDVKIEPVTETVETAEKPTLSFGNLDADGNLTFSMDDNVKFKKSSISFSSPLYEKLDSKVDELKNYLNTEDGKSLSITAYYMSDEINNTAFPNIGFARAVSLKNYFSKKGISTKLMDINGVLNNDMEVDGSNVMKNALKFNVTGAKDQSAMINALIKDITSNPLVVNFETGEATTSLNPKQRLKIVNISTYLDKVDNSSCQIIGHADHVGNDSYNMTLGEERADFVKQFLVKSGLSNTKLNTSSKGESAPIATNNTEAGRAKNRRAVTTVD